MSNDSSHEKSNFEKNLDELKAGETGVVVAISGVAQIRLAELGLTAGVAAKVLRTAPLGDPMEIQLRGYRLCLRKETARQIRVRKFGDPPK